MFVDNIEYIVFSAGSMGGLSLIGAWRALEERGVTGSLKGFAGSSIGAIMAALVSIGFSSSELTEISRHLKYRNLRDLQLLGLLEHMGVETGSKIMALLQGLFRIKTGREHLTFREHWNMTGRYLCITASCVERHECEYFSLHRSPDMSILQAIRMSIAIPWLITAVQWEGYTYVDGALYDPCPVIFPPERTLAFQIINSNAIDDKYRGFAKHTAHILFGIYQRLYKSHFEALTCRVIAIQTGASSVTFTMSRRQRKNTIQVGYETTRLKIAQ